MRVSLDINRQSKKASTFAYESPIGTICCLFEDSALTGLSWQASPDVMTGDTASHDAFRRELDAYFRGELRTFTQEIALTGGTAFQRAVWAALRAIPFGEVRSYRWLAGHVGRPLASRAVGQALKRNPVPLVLPCHRVISSEGSLGGFSCGIERKGWLLAHEAASLARTCAHRPKV